MFNGKGFQARVICIVFGMLVLAGCVGLSDIEEIDQAQLQRDAVLPDPAISLQSCPVFDQGLVKAMPLPPINDRDGCGHPSPYLVQGWDGAYPVRFSSDAKLNCVMMTQLYRFFTEEVQPLAQKHLGQPVSDIQVAASYACRTRNSKKGAKISEHARLNAFDVSAITFADGKVVNVEEDWHSYSKKGKFLRSFNRASCKYFTTVIGPGGDKYHQDHIHLDHGKHGRKGTWRLCQ
ncbi:extensin-like domain-containing protein [Cohaesibacter celericrescens]|uniref:extensin-like domain-containing protein n=1 Tax=Cohaesibacter celericrescens TaxID=2067669 RepID=UPI003565EC10